MVRCLRFPQNGTEKTTPRPTKLGLYGPALWNYKAGHFGKVGTLTFTPDFSTKYYQSEPARPFRLAINRGIDYVR